MAISVTDKRLVEGIEQTLERLDTLQLSSETANRGVDLAAGVLRDALDDYERAIGREDIKDFIAGEFSDLLTEPKSRTGEAMARVYYAVQRRYADRRTQGEPLTERDQEIEEFLRNFSPTDYITGSFPAAINGLERAAGFASQYLPEEVKNLSNAALERARETRHRIEEAGQRALKAFADLEKARDQARGQYLAARDLVSGSLRIEERHDDLNEYVPPLGSVLSP